MTRDGLKEALVRMNKAQAEMTKYMLDQMPQEVREDWKTEEQDGEMQLFVRVDGEWKRLRIIAE